MDDINAYGMMNLKMCEIQTNKQTNTYSNQAQHIQHTNTRIGNT